MRAFGLENTAKQVGGRTLLNDPNWKSSVLAAVGNTSTKITVSLDGMLGSSTYSKVMGAVQQGSRPGASPTNWEMSMLYQGGRLKDASFVEAGKRVANPFTQ